MTQIHPPRPSLAQLREQHVVLGRPLPREVQRLLEVDPRPGAAAILAAVARRRQRNRIDGQRLRRMKRYEAELWSNGVQWIAGVDEAGMGPLAGPVVAAAVILAPGSHLVGVDDSKKLSAAQRQRLSVVIVEQSVSWGVGVAEPEEIDRINIYHAGLLAMQRAVEALTVRAQHLLVDARTITALAIPQTAIIKGDQQSLSIAAASILAKTRRDARMQELDAQFPGYGFAVHKGYPVPAHVAALDRLGPSPVHRRSFAPVRKACARFGGG